MGAASHLIQSRSPLEKTITESNSYDFTIATPTPDPPAVTDPADPHSNHHQFAC